MAPSFVRSKPKCRDRIEQRFVDREPSVGSTSRKWQLMLLRSGPRKILLVLHVTVSVGMLGAVAAFLALAIVGVAGSDPQLARSVYPALALIARLVILPLVFASLVIGAAQSLVTPWGLFRHWWVVGKLAVNLFVAVVLLVQMPGIGFVADTVASKLPIDTLFGVRMSFVIHAAGGLVVLLIPLVLSVYKPRGLTRYGWRKQVEKGTASGS